ncbi:hypothetical protein [Mesorhizobium sp.]|uniref:hypothetical protein n=1 Tax=Mesorhizobium sp. TaxID=1871066 RepID=UPI000A7F6E9D
MKIKIGSLVVGPQIRAPAIVVQQKSGRPVQFELMADKRSMATPLFRAARGR